MATIVAEALLLAFMQLLLEKIVSGEFVDFFLSTKLDVSLLEKLKITLMGLQAVLNDAEEKQITNPAVKEWMDELREAVFEADDLFDEINTEALRCRVEAGYQGQTITAIKVQNILSSPFEQSYGLINSRMLTLFERFENFAQIGHFLALKESVFNSVWHGTPASSVVDEYSIYGRDSDIKKLKDFLLSEDYSDGGCKIGVISIVGMGGVGKTTLAKHLYNDPKVNDKFDLKGWACISKDCDIVKVTKTLLESVTSKSTNNCTLNSLHLESIISKIKEASDLQVQLQKSLSHIKFLIVLDDIWDESYVDLNNLKTIFNAGKMGSKIIITTRDERVALAMQTFLPIHYLRPLESEHCWSLLAKHAFEASNYHQRSNLEVIGKEISKKCHGLPLTAVALGGLLRTKLSQDDWNNILKSNIWELTNNDVQPALLLSYLYLPSHLKQCFAYCSIFPKNSILEKRMVVQLWIAEGLVHQPKSQESWEKVGEEYFDELVSRSLIQQRSVANGEASFEMHDFIKDLATVVSSPYCMRLDEHNLHQRVHHLSYNRGQYDSYNKFDKLYESEGLRTFLPLPLQEPRRSQYSISDRVVHDLLPTMKQLRVLSLSNYWSITKLPTSIGNLICLRYLNLSFTQIKRLPSETCKLYNLQTLLLLGCGHLTKLPEDMGKLVNLRHLDIRGTQLKELPLQISRLQNLQTLYDFIVGKTCDGFKVAELGKFPHLQGELSISELQNVTDPSDASQANLKTKEQVDKLELNWYRFDCIATQGSQIQDHVLGQLQPSTNLKNLLIRSYGGTKFPSWLGDSSFENMVSLSINFCVHCSLLPPLGQLPSLKKLYISGMKSVKSVGTEFYGRSSCPSFQPFPSLETLHFEIMQEWEEWKLIGGTAIEFPNLRHLSLKFCPKLKGNIPRNLPSLTELELRDCDLLVESERSDDNSNIIWPSIVFSQLMLLPLNSLQKLTIKDFPSLRFFPKDGLPKTLQSLTLCNCEDLEFLSHDSLHNYTSLEDLEIYFSCNSMSSFTLGSLPILKNLKMTGCKNLKSIFVEKDALQSLLYLTSVKISRCEELESFSLGGLLTPNLISLVVSTCEKLHSLPEQIKTLSGLQKLEIHNLPNLQYFARKILPINLRELIVANSRGILWNTTVTEWGFECLTCLSVLHIEGDDIVNSLMKMEVPLLPVSLVSLEICQLDEIECLDGKWLQHLTTLQNLEFSFCDNLKSLPEEGLPFSISVLSIFWCSMLEAVWWGKQGKEWSKVAHIPCIVIDGKMIT